MGRLEVRDADRAEPSAPDQAGHSLPCRHEITVVEGRQWPVHEKEVETVEVEPFHALVERMADVVRAMLGVAELCRDVDLIAGYPGFSQCKSHAHFVPVHLRGVDVAIANLERETDYISCLARVLRRGCAVRGDLQCTKTQLRDRCSVVEGDCGDHRLALPLQLTVCAPQTVGIGTSADVISLAMPSAPEAVRKFHVSATMSCQWHSFAKSTAMAVSIAALLV